MFYVYFVLLLIKIFIMARLPQGILGGVLGKVGNVVGSSWKGIAILKSRPLSVANPRTTAQVAQRTKMSNTVAFAQEILSSVIKPLNDRFAQQASGYNDFVRRNIHLFEGPKPSPAADLKISVGKMVAVNPTVINDEGLNNEYLISFPTTLSDSFASADDRAYVVAQNVTNGEIAVSAGEMSRGDGSAVIAFAEALGASAEIQVWLAFRRLDGTVVSNTGYLKAKWA